MVNINDIIENRIEKNLKIVSKTLLVDLPENAAFTVEDFVKMQEKHIVRQSTVLQGKNLEIEFAVKDLIKTISSYKLEVHVEEVSDDDIGKLKKHYNHFMYQALLHCAKNSMNALKKRIGSKILSPEELAKLAAGPKSKKDKAPQPFFEVEIHLEAPRVALHPNLDDIQQCINLSALAILRCFKQIKDWPESDGTRNKAFFDRITKDIEIVRVALLLTGCIQGVRNSVQEYLDTFGQYDWIWQEDKELSYSAFMKTNPNLDDFDRKLRSFGDVDRSIEHISDTN